MIKIYKGQTYENAGGRRYIRRDGSATWLDAWRSRCADCGEPFEFLTPSKAAKFGPNRRCQKHKRPGCRVKV